MDCVQLHLELSFGGISTLGASSNSYGVGVVGFRVCQWIKGSGQNLI